MTYPESIQFLYDLQLFGAKFGLENVRRLAALAGNPHENLRFIHVAGTNGKGSTCAMLESIYRAAGYRVGLYTSPHLVSFCERIQVNRELINEEAVAGLVERLRPLLEQFPREQHPTFFEVVTVMALLYFAEQKCDLVVWETGMGGRLDATNIVTPLASVITNVGLDHQRWLGDTIEQIAAEKAGIIKPGLPVITATDDGRALSAIQASAARRNAPVILVDRKQAAAFSVSLRGEFQLANAATAITTVRAIEGQFPVTEAHIRQGLADVRWPGRMHEVHLASGNRVLLDGAHNLPGVESLAQELRTRYPGARPTLIFGVLQDKDWRRMLEILVPLIDHVFFVPVQSNRGLDTAELMAAAVANPALRATACSSVAEALRLSAHTPLVIVTGSLYLVGEAIELLIPGVASGRDERALNEWTAPGSSR